MTVELIVTVQVAGPEVPETMEEETRIEEGARKQVEDAIRAADIKCVGVELASEAWADLQIYRAKQTNTVA